LIINIKQFNYYYKTTTYKVIATLHTGRTFKDKFSVDGKYCLVTNASDGTISVYNQKSKNKIKTIHIHGKTTILERIPYPVPVNILMHPMDCMLVASNANKVEVIDMKNFTIVSTIGTGRFLMQWHLWNRLIETASKFYLSLVQYYNLKQHETQIKTNTLEKTTN
jgi:WD40 repeat protein